MRKMEINCECCGKQTYMSVTALPFYVKYHNKSTTREISPQKYISYCVCNHDHYLIQKPVVKATYRRFTEADYRNYLRRQNQ